MEEIIEQYGIGLLQILGGVAVIMLWRTFFCDDGILRQCRRLRLLISCRVMGMFL